MGTANFPIPDNVTDILALLDTTGAYSLVRTGAKIQIFTGDQLAFTADTPAEAYAFLAGVFHSTFEGRSLDTLDQQENAQVRPAAPQYLFTVTDVFVITNRGIVLAPGVPCDQHLRVGTRIGLRRPDGSDLPSTIAGIELIEYPPDTPLSKRTYPIVLPPSVTASDVPIGTTVWLGL